jgi:hypothetical protein
MLLKTGKVTVQIELQVALMKHPIFLMQTNNWGIELFFGIKGLKAQ